MESVESPLEVLSRAATMMQHCHNFPASDSDSFESPSTASGGESEGDRTLSPETPPLKTASKELPTAKWRRERRSNRLPDYKPRENGNKALRSQSFNERRHATPLRVDRSITHSDGESPDEAEDMTETSAAFTARAAANGSSKANGKVVPPPDYPTEAPIDMRLRNRPSPPPYPHQASAPRASVITHSTNDQPSTGSVSMCDPVIDEHFRRSLGDQYMTLFAKKAEAPAPPPAPKRSTKDRGSSPITFASDPCTNFLKDKKVDQDTKEEQKVEVEMEVDSASSSVDAHFTKALGDTWRKIQISRLMEKPENEKAKKEVKRQGVVI